MDEHTARMDRLVQEWLDAKYARSGSAETRIHYGETMQHFRAALGELGLDLDSDPLLVADCAAAFVERRWRQDAREPLSSRTRNQRMTYLSSFYRYAQRKGQVSANPIERLERRPETTRFAAWPMAAETVMAKLAAIDCSTLLGFRDYTLLLLAFLTGRRRSELAGLRWGHIWPEGDRLVVKWVRCKGGKVMYDELTGTMHDVMRVYLEQLETWYQQRMMALLAEVWSASLHADIRYEVTSWMLRAFIAVRGDLGVWPNIGGIYDLAPFTPRTLNNITHRRLGTSKVHTTRHTFAILMEEANAKLSEIGERLGHSNLKTTADYMNRLHSPQNPRGEQISNLLHAKESWQNVQEQRAKGGGDHAN